MFPMNLLQSQQLMLLVAVPTRLSSPTHPLFAAPTRGGSKQRVRELAAPTHRIPMDLSLMSSSRVLQLQSDNVLLFPRSQAIQYPVAL